jgi:hypothetical protein
MISGCRRTPVHATEEHAMTFLPNRRHRIAAVVTAATLTLGGGAAAVVAATAPGTAGAVSGSAALSAATVPTGSAATGHAASRAGRAARRRLLARTDHATIELKMKGQWVTIDLDRGRVTSVSPTAISLARPDGHSVTLAIDSATKFGHHATVSTLKTGVEAIVTSENGTARRIVEPLHPKAAATPSTTTSA